MTKKDYQMLADAIAEETRLLEPLTPGEKLGALSIVQGIAAALHRENSRFGRKRFIEACGPLYVENLDPKWGP